MAVDDGGRGEVVVGIGIGGVVVFQLVLMRVRVRDGDLAGEDGAGALPVSTVGSDGAVRPLDAPDLASPDLSHKSRDPGCGGGGVIGRRRRKSGGHLI